MSHIQLIESYEKLHKALISLELILKARNRSDRSNIDATIQRFEFTIELFWKFLKRILDSKGIEVRFPKDVLKEAYAGHLIDDEQTWLDMLRDRNLTSHTYDEELADRIYENIKIYFPILDTTTQKLQKMFLDPS
jgi:nucleotidyltransferase substrate binding protein (TIGR01987 family)